MVKDRLATIDRPRRKAKARSISAHWRRLFGLIPHYDPVATAAPGEWFDESAADAVCEFFKTCLKHVKGPLAGKPFILSDWQTAVTACLFGWKRADGTRRYRESLVYVAKKNGKTAWAAGVVLYLLTCDGEKGAEVYSAAASRDQAALIFSHAAGMVQQEPELSSRLRVYGGKGGTQHRSIVYAEAMSSYKCLAADSNTADGVNVHGAVVDELHRHKTPELAEILQKSTAARTQPLVVYTTTADYNRESLCNTKLKYARDVCMGTVHDSSFLPVVFECDKDDDWKSPAVWRKANPNLDVTIPTDFLARECQKAVDTPSELNNFLRLHLNIVTDADEAFFDMAQWDECDSLTDNLDGRPCYAGLDLSTTKDITAFVMVFPDDDGDTTSYDVLCRFWVPADTVDERERKDGVPYRGWVLSGHLQTTPGNVVDYDRIRAEIVELSKQHEMKEVAIDRWNSTQLQTQLLGDGLTVVQFGQGFASMTAPTKELEKLVVSGRLRHAGHPVLRWMAGNCMVENDAAGNLKPSKKKSSEKIDGIVALTMALGRAIVSEGDGQSVYETQGLVYV